MIVTVARTLWGLGARVVLGIHKRLTHDGFDTFQAAQRQRLLDLSEGT